MEMCKNLWRTIASTSLMQRSNMNRSVAIRAYLALVLLMMSSVGLCQGPGYAQTHSKEFAVDGGTVVVSDIQLFASPLGAKIRANVQNRSSKNLLSAGFNLSLRDRAGNELANQTISIFDLKAGGTQSLGLSGDGENIMFTNVRNMEARIEAFDMTLRWITPTVAYVFSMVKPQAVKDLRFTDDFIEVQFTITSSTIALQLTNKTDNPIKIDWNNVAYVDTLRNSHKVVAKGTRYIERDKPQQPATVPPNARLQDRIHPSDLVEYLPNLRKWHEKPLFPGGAAAETYKDQSFSVFMPLEINGTIKNYNFVFRIDGVLFGQ